MKLNFVCLLLPLLVLFTSCARHSSREVLPGSTIGTFRGGTVMAQDDVVLHGNERMVTPEAFRPPLEIHIVAKTDLTNLRMDYGGQFIFNWELNPDELRVNGGPADRVHKSGAGRIPAGKFVAIRWVVTKTKQSIWVDDELRYEHEGNYSNIISPVSVYPAFNSVVTVKSLKVVKLKDGDMVDNDAPFFQGEKGSPGSANSR